MYKVWDQGKQKGKERYTLHDNWGTESSAIYIDHIHTVDCVDVEEQSGLTVVTVVEAIRNYVRKTDEIIQC